MNATSPSPPSSDPEKLSSAPSESYAEQAREAYEASPEEPRSLTGRSIEFLSSIPGKLWGTFKEADLVGKGAMVAAGAATAYIGIKVLEKGISLFRRTWDRFSSLGDSLTNGLDKIRGISIKKTIAILLGSSALVALFLNLDDLMEFWDEANDHPEGLLAGLQAGITTRILNGFFDISDEKWDELAEKHAWFPSRERRDAVKEVFEDVRQGAADLKENVTEGIVETVDWMSEFSEKSGLNALSTKVASFFGSEMVFDGWESDSVLAPLRELSDDPAKIAEYLGITDAESLRNFVVASGGVATSTYLLTRLMGSPWGSSLKLAGFNVGLYMFFQSEGVESHLVEGIEWLHDVETKLHDATTKILKHLGIVKSEAIGLSIGPLKIQDAINLMFELAKDYPSVSALAVIDAAYFMRHAILAVAAACFRALVSGLINIADFAVDHPLAAAATGGVAALTICERRHVIKELSRELYPNDDQSEDRRQFIDDMRAFLDAIPFADLDISDDPTFGEAAWKPIYEQMVADPVKWFSDPDRRFALHDYFRKGFFRLNFDVYGNWILTAGAIISPLAHGIRLEDNIVQSIFDEWEERGVSMENLNVYATYSGELYLTTAALVGTVRGYHSLISKYNGKAGGVPRLLKSLVNPKSREFRHVLRSMVRETADWASGRNATLIKQSFQLRDFSVESKVFFDIADKLVALDSSLPNYTEEFVTLKAKLNTTADLAATKVPKIGDSLTHAQDKVFIEKLRSISAELRSTIFDRISETNLPINEIQDLKMRLARLQAESRWFDWVSKGSQIYDPTGTLGRFYEFANTSKFKVADFETLVDELGRSPAGETAEARATRIQELGRVSMEYEARFPAEFKVYAHMKPGEFLNPLPELSNPELKLRADDLRGRGVSLESILEMDKIPGLDKANIDGFIEAIDKDSTVVHKANDVMYEIRYKGQLNMIHKFKLYEGMSFLVAVLLTYEFQNSKNKSEFYSHVVTGVGGFSAGIAAVRTAEHFTSKFPPWIRFCADLGVGALGAWGLSAVASDFLSSKIYRKHPNIDVEGSRIGEDLLHEFGSAGDVLMAAGMGRGMFDMVDEDTHPIDYLSHTIRTFKPIGEKNYFKDSMRKDYYHRFEEDLAYNAEQRILSYQRKIEKKKRKLTEVDSSTEKAMKLEREIADMEDAIKKLETYVDGSWVRIAQEELDRQDDAVMMLKLAYMEIANKKFLEPDNRGASVVSTMVARLGIGQDIIDKEDMEVWEYLYAHPPIELPGEEKIDFRAFVIFSSTVKRRKKQMEELGYDSLPSESEPLTA